MSSLGAFFVHTGRLLVFGGFGMLAAGYVILLNQPPRNPLMEERHGPRPTPGKGVHWIGDEEGNVRAPLKDEVEPVEEVKIKTSPK